MGVRHHDYIMVSVIFRINGACRFSPVSFIRAMNCNLRKRYRKSYLLYVKIRILPIYMGAHQRIAVYKRTNRKKKCVKINIYILWGNLLKINYLKIWKIILILNYFNVYNHILSKLSLKNFVIFWFGCKSCSLLFIAT